jgi:hypothetical protein
MHRKTEQQMFFAAMVWAIDAVPWYRLDGISWAGNYRDQLVPEETVTVLWPRGTAFKNPGCVVQCRSTHVRTRQLLAEYNPVRITTREGDVYFFFDGGQHVLAATGASASIRRQEEG